MVYKLDLIDRKILVELDTDARTSFAKIGKRIGVGKNNVQYRVARLVEDGVIKKFVLQPSLSKLGLFLGKIYLQMSGYTEQTEEIIYKFLLNDKRISWVAKCEGNWDIMLGAYVENVQQFNKLRNDFFERFGQYVNNYDVVFLTEGRTSQRTYLLNKKSFYSKKVEDFMGKGKIKLKKNDVKILRFISNNARFSYTEVAKKFRMNVKTVQSRIKKMEQMEIIQGYVTFLDIRKIGYNFFKLCLHTKGKTVNDIVKYCLEMPNVVHVIESVGPWEVELEVETENLQDFYDLMHNIRNKFSDSIKKTDFVVIVDEVKLDFFPTWY